MNKKFDSMRIFEKEKLALRSIDLKARHFIIKCSSNLYIYYYY